MVERPTGGEQESNFTRPPHIRGEVPPLLLPNEEFLTRRGWDSFAELMLDVAGYFPKPQDPSIPKDDIEALNEDALFALGLTANEWEESMVNTLADEGHERLVEPFKQQMQEYRKTVKAIVQMWRESGLL